MAMKLNMLPPSVNNMSVRVFVRAAGIPVEEENVWGQTQEQEYLSKYPPGLTPTIETDELPKGVLGESCAVMMYLSTREGRDDLYPSDPKKRAMVDAANFYTLSIFYPLMARATYPRLGFAGYPGEVSTSDASDELKEAARKSAEDSLPKILDVYPAFWGTDTGFIGAGTRRRSPISGSRPRSSFSRPPTPGSPVGRRTTSGESSRRSATRTASRPATCAATWRRPRARRSPRASSAAPEN